MVLTWMLYASAVALLAGLSALAVEESLRLVGRPARWVWTAATALSLAVPVWAWWAPPADTGVSSGAMGAVGSSVVVSSPAGLDRVLELPDLTVWDGAARTGWLVLSGLLLLHFGASAARLALLRHRWPETRLEDTVVRVSPGLGPAAVGFLRPEVILPRWVLEGDPVDRRWIVAHEVEHVRARDPARVAISLLAVLLFPWNLALWWQLRRLRLAVEADCDARVLGAAGAAERRRYGTLLLEVGMRSVRGLPLPAFAESPGSLEHRIRIMTRSIPAQPKKRIALLTAAGTLLIVAACIVPGPDRSTTLTAPEVETEGVEAVAAETTEQEPTFTPFTVAPKLLNEEEVNRALEEEYPPLLKDAGVGGVVRFYFFVDPEGSVETVRFQESSGNEALDAAAGRVARVMRFAPAMNGDEVVPVWISVPISFGDVVADEANDEGGNGTDEPEDTPRPDADTRDRSELAAGPTFTPYTLAPRLTNQTEVMAALEASYPPLLRNGGVGGRADVYFFIDAEGNVGDVRINNSSGHEALDAAALEVARSMRFQPALNRDSPVPVWISLPITFQVR